MLKKLGIMLENDGVRLQIEAERKSEITEKEWLSIVETKYFPDVKNRMADLSCSFEEAYKDMMY